MKKFLRLSHLCFPFPYKIGRDIKTFLCHKDGGEKPKPKNQFHNPFLAFITTTLWSVGEISHEEEDKFRFEFTFYNFLANLFVLIFFFLIVLVFMNFLNGLAVSDVRELKQDAEIRNQILRIDIIYHTGMII